MRKLSVFNSISLDGYFTDAKNDMSWAHEGSDDPEFAAFTKENAKGGGGVLVFGRVTYELMKSYWPTPQAEKDNPEFARQMTRLEKIVFSRTLTDPGWENVRVVNADPATELRRLKQEDDERNMIIMGSGKIIAQIAGERLIDEYQMIFCPLVLGAGRTMFEGLQERPRYKLLDSRAFKNGKIFTRYAPV